MLSHVHLVETISHSLYYSTGKLCRFLFFLYFSSQQLVLLLSNASTPHTYIVYFTCAYLYLLTYLYYDAGTTPIILSNKK